MHLSLQILTLKAMQVRDYSAQTDGHMGRRSSQAFEETSKDVTSTESPSLRGSTWSGNPTVAHALCALTVGKYTF